MLTDSILFRLLERLGVYTTPNLVPIRVDESWHERHIRRRDREREVPGVSPRGVDPGDMLLRAPSGDPGDRDRAFSALATVDKSTRPVMKANARRTICRSMAPA